MAKRRKVNAKPAVRAMVLRVLQAHDERIARLENAMPENTEVRLDRLENYLKALKMALDNEGL